LNAKPGECPRQGGALGHLGTKGKKKMNRGTLRNGDYRGSESGKQKKAGSSPLRDEKNLGQTKSL